MQDALVSQEVILGAEGAARKPDERLENGMVLNMSFVVRLVFESNFFQVLAMQPWCCR